MRNLLFLTLVGGCFNPDLSESMFTCTAKCPSGFDCVAGECVRPGTSPTITIVEPDDGDELDAALDFTLAVEIVNFDLNPTIPDDLVEGQGHWHWFIDDVYQAGVSDTEIAASPLEAGCHVLKVDLRQNNHEAVAPIASNQVSVYSSDGGPTICIVTPPAGETVEPGEIAVAVDVRDFVLDEAVAAGNGHWHVWVDEDQADDHFFTESGTVTIPSEAGPHRIKAELVGNSDTGPHPPIVPPRTATVVVTVVE